MKLNLPDYGPKLAKKSGKPVIFDEIRRKYVALAPEEWVRQHFVHFLLAQGYPKALLAVETTLRYGRLRKRADIVAYDRQGAPYLLAECKAPDVEIDAETLAQAAAYERTLGAPHLALTNGLRHLYFSKQEQGGTLKLVEALPLPPI